MNKQQLYILEALIVVLVITIMGSILIPKFLTAQNINTPQHFPDPNFRAAVETFMGVEPGGVFTKTQAAEQTGTLEFNKNKVMDTTGLTLLKSVTKIEAQDNQIKTIDLSSQTDLESINLDKNQLTTLDVSKNMKLKTLICSNNQLNDIKLAEGGEMFSLIVNGNNLTTLDVSTSPKLYDLFFGGNQIREIDLSHNPDLKRLLNMSGFLTAIDVSNNTKLYCLQIMGNQIEKFPDLTNNSMLEVIDLRLNNIGCDSLKTIKSFKHSFKAKMNYSFQYSQQNGMELDECASEN